jgi:F-type H+-transporting ATPase subunit epsilon
VAAVDAGFFSVADNRVSILSEHAEMSHEIDLEKAKADLERAHAAGEDDEEARSAVARAQARIRAVEMAQ